MRDFIKKVMRLAWAIHRSEEKCSMGESMKRAWANFHLMEQALQEQDRLVNFEYIEIKDGERQTRQARGFIYDKSLKDFSDPEKFELIGSIRYWDLDKENFRRFCKQRLVSLH